MSKYSKKLKFEISPPNAKIGRFKKIKISIFLPTPVTTIGPRELLVDMSHQHFKIGHFKKIKISIFLTKPVTHIVAKVVFTFQNRELQKI